MRKFVSVLAVLVFAVSLFGCSSDNDTKSAKDHKKASTTTTTETPALDPNQIDTKASPYCATWAEIRGAGALPSQDAAAVKKFYSGLLPSVEKLLNEAPADIKPSVQVAYDATKTVAGNGELSEFQKPPVVSAQKKLADYAVEHCKKK